MRLGIDASNLRGGGGVTHLVELLKAARPEECGIDQVVVWSGQTTLRKLPNRPWLVPGHSTQLDGPLPMRVAWQQFELPRRAAGMDAVFAPGATPSQIKPPVVVMCQNMLPFEPQERQRYGWSAMGVKLRVLEQSQARAFRRAAGVIFLTHYAQDAVQRRIGRLNGQQAIIPHGVANEFRCQPRPARPVDAYSDERPFRLVYVSIVNLYKHQWLVAEAVARLRQAGLPVAIDFLGPAYDPALERLQAALQSVDPGENFARYLGAVDYQQLAAVYRGADAFVYASSCENLPIILLEAMAAGLPIASSNRGPMPEVLGDAGVYFDPEDIDDIEDAIRTLVLDLELRTRCAELAYQQSLEFSWERCAQATLKFIVATARQ